jgi:hypothetical protein
MHQNNEQLVLLVEGSQQLGSASELVPPNGLPFNRAAPIDRDSIVAASGCQNGYDLVDAQRHRLEWRVGRGGGGRFGGECKIDLALRHLPCLGKTAQAAASTRRRNNSKLARP